jgi:ribosome-associated heat shock protein Hsp15
MDEQAGVRVDRWLWAARFYRTRSLAKSAVEGGKVHVNEQRVKPAKELQVGQTVRVNKDGVIFTVTVLQLSEQRGSATIAQTLYCETPQSIEQRQIAVSERRMARAGLNIPAQRPNKRDRRARSQLRALDQQWADEDSGPSNEHQD